MYIYILMHACMYVWIQAALHGPLNAQVVQLCATAWQHWFYMVCVYIYMFIHIWVYTYVHIHLYTHSSVYRRSPE